MYQSNIGACLNKENNQMRVVYQVKIEGESVGGLLCHSLRVTFLFIFLRAHPWSLSIVGDLV